MLGALEATFVLSFGLFLLCIKRKYVRTFFDTNTAKQHLKKCFLAATSDEARSEVLEVHPSLYSDFVDDIKLWVQERQAVWDYERPPWLSERLRASIPVVMSS